MPNKTNKVKISLRIQIALGVVFPMLIGMVLLSAFHITREQQLIEEQTLQAAIQMGEIISSGLRHSVIENDPEMLDSIINDVINSDSISRIRVLSSSGIIQVDSSGDDLGNIYLQTESGCVECHQYEVAERPSAIILPSLDSIRVAIPVHNSENCSQCDDASTSQKGVLFIDTPLQPLNEHFVEDLKIEIAVVGTAVFVGGFALYFLLNLLVVRRVEKFGRYLETYADGDFSIRMPAPSYQKDELDELVFAVNDMAEELEQRDLSEHKRQQLQKIAIKEERDSIARELHDGMAQLSGFVRAKASAIRLSLKNGKTENAMMNLSQLEEAAQNLSVEVREAILRLKISGLVGSGLVSMLRDYVDQFRRLSHLLVKLSIPIEIEDIPLLAETELHCLRIVQEALSNARKHAEATEVTLAITKEDNFLKLMIEDNGKGFDPEDANKDKLLKFGISGMRERAELIGGTFAIISTLGSGTRVLVTLPLTGEEIL